ncbi:DUF916 domain-containing protein [Dactylosporangium sp. NPDC005572]|uniref:WxL protein peptidoglycan domain-containing protein n=1 Tax=Dactylosporangium sp. NPDC005572 TaxID=3156889 RepID=UPI00339F003A
MRLAACRDRTTRSAAVLLAVLCAAVLLCPVPGHATPAGTTWAVVPSTANGPNGRAAFEYKLDPGATVTDYAGIANYGSEPLTVEVYASDAFTTPQGGFDLLPASKAPTDVGSWVMFNARSMTVPPKSRLDVPFRLTVPANATPGDHAGGIVASVVTRAVDGSGNQVAVDRRAGSRIYLRVSGALHPTLQIENIDGSYEGTPNPLRGGTVEVTYLVRNTGNVRLTGRAALVTEGPFGLGRRRVDLDPIPEILPGQAYTATARLSGVAPLVRLSATVSVLPVGPGQQVLDPAPVLASGQVPVWAWPWSQALVLLTLVAAVWLAWRWRRRSRRRLAAAIEQARRQGRDEARTGSAADAAVAGSDDAGDAPGTVPHQRAADVTSSYRRRD